MGLLQLIKRVLFGDAAHKKVPTPPLPQVDATRADADARTAIMVGAAAYGAAKSTGSLDAHSSQHFSPPAMAGAIAALNTLPPEQRTPEKARELGVQMGMWDAINNPPPPSA